jgi:ATP-binding cassette subfamily F protein 3
MLTAHHLTKYHNLKPILLDVSFSLNPGDHFGLIGPNGSGKSTLIRILAGLEQPDDGVVTAYPENIHIGYLPQVFEVSPLLTVGEFLDSVSDNKVSLSNDLEKIAELLTRNPNREDLQKEFDLILSKLNAPAVSEDYRRDVLHQLALDQIISSTKMHTLSGGQKTRLILASILLQEPDLLLLDEPTNHLDIEMLEWLETWISSYKGPCLIVSHDRTFLDHTAHQILDLDPETHFIRRYPGNYSEYVDHYLHDKELISAAYRDQVYEIRRMRQDIARTKQQAKQVELSTTSRQPGIRRYAKKVAKKAKAREKKLDRFLGSDQRIEKPKQSWQMNIKFGQQTHHSQTIMHLEQLTIGYPDAAPLLLDINQQILHEDRIALVGPNGSGKSTLIKVMVGMLDPLQGRIINSDSTKIGYMPQEQTWTDFSQSALDLIQNVAPLNQTEARAFLHYYLFSGDDALRPISQLSIGERARLTLASLVAKGCNFLILDEPINHLDIPSRERFEQALTNFEGTILAVVHDRYFIDRFAAKMWRIQDHRLQVEYLIT